MTPAVKAVLAFWIVGVGTGLLWMAVCGIVRRCTRKPAYLARAVVNEPGGLTPDEVLDRIDSLREQLAELSPAARECARDQLFTRWADAHPFMHASSAPVLRCVKRAGDGDTIVRGEN